MTALRVMVVDDEQLARDELCYQLGQLAEVEVVAQAGNGIEALSAADRVDPDLVFLDIQMPGLSGFEVARRLLQREEQGSPALVFVTAFDQQAIARARRRLSSDRAPDPVNDQIERIVKMMANRQIRRDQVAIKVGERFL